MSGYTSYLTTNAAPAAPAATYAPTAAPAAAAAPAWGTQTAPMQAGANPYLTPDQLWMALGYYTQPTEVDIDSDLLNSYSPMASFLTEQQGLLILAQLVSTVVDHRLQSFFENYMIMLMEAEDGSGMFLKPRVEQISEEGARLKGLSQTTVQAELTQLSDHLKSSFVDPGREVISTHKMAASLLAQSSGLDAILTAAGGNAEGPGALSNLVNLGLHVGTGGIIPRIQPVPATGPVSVPPMTPPVA